MLEYILLNPCLNLYTILLIFNNIQQLENCLSDRFVLLLNIWIIK